MPDSKTKGNIDYSARLKAIRPYVDFNYDLRKPLSSGAKGKINKYFEFLDDKVGKEGKNLYLYRGRKKANIEKAKAAAGTPPELKGLKVAFIPTLGNDVRVRFDKKGDLHIKTEFVSSTFIEFNPLKLIGESSEVIEYINSLLDKHDFKTYTITYGDFDSPDMAKQFVGEQVARLAAKYDVKGNHNYKNWLFGVNGLKFTNQKPKADYLAEKKAAIMARKYPKTNKRK